ncbi:MAG: macro domain-containing protein [Solobacterium sp.]|nr:macro domain-containing protein [Solobacterium sp.]
MPFEIVRNDIASMHTDAVVNTANPYPVAGRGVDIRIHTKAGPELMKARKQYGELKVTDAVITPGFRLPARYVIHVCGPQYIDGTHNEEEQLRQSYRNALALALENGCESIAFPLLSSGSYHFPKEEALNIAVSEFSRFLAENDMDIKLVVFDKEALGLSKKLVDSVRSFIDDRYVGILQEEEHFYVSPTDIHERKSQRREEKAAANHTVGSIWNIRPNASMERPESAHRPQGLERFLKKKEKGFSETLLEKIDASGMKDSEVYRKANISRKHFSKIRSNPDYKPSKNTVIAFAFALGMDLAETKRFLATAGYALSRSSVSDVIVEYFLTTDNHDLYELNEILFLYDQQLIGNVS